MSDPPLTATLIDGLAVVLRESLALLDPDGVHPVVLVRTRSLLGSDARCDVVIEGAAVSRHHAVIERPLDGTAIVRDIGSRNGTRIDGVRVLAAPLFDGARLALGDAVRIVRACGKDPELLELSPSDRFAGLVGHSVPMRRVFAELAHVAPTLMPVLLLGETGTGKELAARAIHTHSPRREGPFVVLDCGAANERLFDAEVFGYVRGAFTGAEHDRGGLFEQAEGGTIFIDELGELPLSSQKNLLRVLDRGEIRRIGETSYRAVDVRVVCATHRDLDVMVAAGAFRADLLHRIRVMEIRLPSLRERIEDLPLLAETIAAQLLGAEVSAEELLGPESIRTLRRHSWPGNVRELRNWVLRAVRLGRMEIDPLGLERALRAPPPLDPERPWAESRTEWMRYFEREMVTRLLERHRGNVAAAARAVGMDRSHFARLMSRFAIQRPGE